MQFLKGALVGTALLALITTIDYYSPLLSWHGSLWSLCCVIPIFVLMVVLWIVSDDDDDGDNSGNTYIVVSHVAETVKEDNGK